MGNAMMWIAAGLAVLAIERSCWAAVEANKHNSELLGVLAFFLLVFAFSAMFVSFGAWRTVNG